jgi:hypothetical protein
MMAAKPPSRANCSTRHVKLSTRGVTSTAIYANNEFSIARTS